MRTYTLEEIARRLQARLVGDPGCRVAALNTLDVAADGDISFLSDDRYQAALDTTKASAVVLREEHAQHCKCHALVVQDPYLAYAKLSAIFNAREKRAVGVHESAVVSNSAQIDPTASIGANCVIGDGVVLGAGCEIYPGVTIAENAQVGANCLIYSNVSIYSHVTLGDRVIVHSGTVLGSDGFGYAPSATEKKQKKWEKIHQLGGVRIGDDVEIGANCAIDRGALSPTIIHDRVIIDNLVHIAHNVEVGEASAIAGCVGIAGSTKIGKNCTVAGMVAINGHIEIADNSHFHGGTIVTKGIDEPGAYASTSPMQSVAKWRRTSVRMTQLDDWAQRIKQLEKRLKQLEDGKD